MGCVIYELFTGKILFPGRSNNEMLKLMMDVKGAFPKKMLKRGQFVNQHFEDDPNMSFALQEEDPVTRHPVSHPVTHLLSLTHSVANSNIFSSRTAGDSPGHSSCYDLPGHSNQSVDEKCICSPLDSLSVICHVIPCMGRPSFVAILWEVPALCSVPLTLLHGACSDLCMQLPNMFEANQLLVQLGCWLPSSGLNFAHSLLCRCGG